MILLSAQAKSLMATGRRTIRRRPAASGYYQQNLRSSALLRFFISLLGALLRGLAEDFWMQVRAALRDRFHLFDLDAMRFGVSVFANACQLPRHFHPRFAARDLESVPVHFLRYVNRSEAADAGQLIAELAVERFEPIWQRNHGRAVFAEGNDAVVDVHHIG